MEPIAIAMITDFFHLNVGGKENDVYMLSANLIERGPKIVVITHSHSPNRVVYFLGHEGILHSHLLGVRTVFTDRSLLGFEDARSILTNKLLAGTLRNVNAVIFTIVVLSRLAYGKGVNLLIATAPRICSAFPDVRFAVGAIFLNTSLTESFGIAVLEEACTGPYVVSTRLGGVPEILPEHMISFAEPEEDDVFRAISEAIEIISEGKHDPIRAHERIKTFYDWVQVTEPTEVKSRQTELWQRMKRTMGLGPFAGPIYLIILVVDCLFFMFVQRWFPGDGTDFVASHWDHDRLLRLVL
ncbi:transferase [Armillaria fumosa]|nr:transferase [Armillaria fumosa]